MAKSDKPKHTELFTKDGRSYLTSDKVEITRLLAHGYSKTDPTAKTPATKPSSTPPSS